METSALQKLSREELHAKVWATPGRLLSKELGVSDVAIAKRCRILSVPRPPRGYWAKVKAGARVKEVPLPAPEDLKLDPLPKAINHLKIPKSTAKLCRLAGYLLKNLEKKSPGMDGRISLQDINLPDIHVTKSLIGTACRSFHTILNGVEAIGISFNRGSYYSKNGNFERNNCHLNPRVSKIA